MDGCGKDNQDIEDSAIEDLILWSDNADNDDKEFDDFVTSGWDEVSCGWRNTKPNAHYVLSAGKRKRSKEKLQISPEPDSQLAKVKKLAGMIANSNLHRDGNSSTKLKSARISALTKYQNCGVLSYDVPCWRFVIDPKQYHYIERLSFVQLLSISDRRTNTTHTILLENGGMITCQEINGQMALFDPALSFDKHLLETYIDREDFRLKSCQKPVNCSFDYATKFINFCQTRAQDNRIHVVQTLSMKPTLEPCSSVCEMCRHRTQELEKTDSKSSNNELKPLLKITPTQRRVAEDSRLAGKVLLHHDKKDLSLKTSKRAKNILHIRHAGLRLDWLPITRSTIAYPYIETMTGNQRVSNDKFPDRVTQGTTKTYALPRGHAPKARKLTLSEAANLVPKTSKLGHAIDKLAKELENKQEKPLGLSEPILPSVSGTKLEVALSGCLSGT